MSGRLVSFLVLPYLLTGLHAQDRSTERFDLALGLIKRGMHDDAARQLRRFLADQPKSELRAEALYRLGTCQLEQKDEKGAIKSFRESLAAGKFKLRAECRYRLGHLLMPTDPKAAAAQFARLVQESGAKHYLAAPSLYAQGESLRAAELDPQALAAYRAAAEADADAEGPFAAPSLYQAGFIQLRAKKFREAEALFETAARRFPKHQAYGECRFLQGEAALRGGRFDVARGAFELSVQAGGEFADDAALGIGQAERGRKDVAKAVAAYRQVAASFPTSPLAPKALLEAGRTLYDAGQFAPAEQQLSQVVDRRGVPQDILWPALELRGLARLDQKRPEDAAADLGRAVELARTPADQGRMNYSLGEAFADAGNWQESFRAYGQCAATTQDEDLKGDALYGQCLALHRLKRYEDANRIVARFLKALPKHRLRTVVVFAGGENSFALKRYEEADQVYAQIPASHELAGKAAFKRAWCSYLAGDFKTGAARFASVASAGGASFEPLAEQALSMEALAWLEAGSLLPALKAADRYRSRFPRGSYLARTERVAARVLKRQGKLKEAGSRLAAAAAAETSGDVASGDRLEFAEVLFKQGRFDEARKAYTEIASRDDRIGARAHEGLAWCAFELGDDKDCASWIDKGLSHPKLGDGRPGLLELKSALHHRRQEWGDAERAATLYLTDFAEHPRANELRYARGVALARAGQFDAARQVLGPLRSTKMDRIDRVFYEYAWACRKLEDEKGALAAFRRVAETTEDVDMAGESRLHVGEALLQAKDDSGLKWLEAVKGRYAARAQYLCGYYRFEGKKYPAALTNFDRIVKLGESDLFHEAQFFAGECLFRQDQFAPAGVRYQVLLGARPNHPRAQVARLRYGQCMVRSNNPRAAAMVLQDYLRRAAASKPQKIDLARAHLWLGKARQLEKDFRRAEIAFRQVTDLTESELSAEAQYRIGVCRASAGKDTDAVDAFVKLSILYSHAEWVQRGLHAAGDSYLRLKQPAKAAKLFEELIQRFPKSDLAKSAGAKLKTIRSQK